MKGILLALGGIVLVAVAASALSSGESPTQVTQTQNELSEENNMTQTMELKNIAQTAEAAGSFSTLLTALTEADLATTIATGGPFTVFAPTDEAFEALPEGTLEAVLADQDKLKSILLYHVVSGKVMAADVVTMTSAETLQGGDLSITTDGGVKVNGVNVVQTDIEASNGVIHVVDQVLLPQ